MSSTPNKPVRVAILDLYEGVENQGMRCIRALLSEYSLQHHIPIEVQEFEVRISQQVPDLGFDIYISSGGPGSPLDSENSEWEKAYFGWLESVLAYNNNKNHFPGKQVLFICHSYQLASRHFGVAAVVKRRSTAFGIFPVHLLHEGREEPLFAGMADPFYAVDSRDYQVIQPNYQRLRQMGAKLLCIEK